MKFLVFQHVPHEHLGLINNYTKEKNIEIEVIEFWKPYIIPSVTNLDALVIMGGPMGVYENKETFPSKMDELEVIKEAIDKKIPTIGFCLGSQLIASALGAKVYPNVKDGKKIKEVGYYDVNLTPEGINDPIFKNFTNPINVLQWHGDIFDLPDGATRLANSPLCETQAFKYGKNIYGMLFHNEFTPEMVKNLIKIDNKWIHDNFNLNEDKFKEQSEEYEDRMKKQCTQLFDNFLTLVNKSTTQSNSQP